MNTQSHAVKGHFRLYLPLLCLLIILALTGCDVLKGKKVLDPGGPIPVTSPLDEAKNAYFSGNYSKAEAVAKRLASDASLPDGLRVEANRILAAAALKNNHPSVALSALDDWRLAVRGVDDGKEWQDAWCKAMRSLSSHDARTRANELYQDGSRSQLIRSVAGVFLAVRQWRDGELGQTMVALENIYASAGSREKAVLERRLALELHLAPASASNLAAGAVTDANKNKFPYSIILIDKLRRAGDQTALAALANEISLTDASLFKNPPSESEISIQPASGGMAAPSTPVAGQPVVLALPMSGQYATMAAKIEAGARLACSESGQRQLIVIDTTQPDWTAKVDALPPTAAVIGGPLQRADYAKAKSSGLTSRRAMFAFLPSLEGNDEGRVAWRFFGSAKDQVDALLGFTSRLGIKGYGVFYPEENFGSRMSSLFDERARAAGASTVVTQGYDPADQNNWMAATNHLLGANKSGSMFQAIFLPDSWKNMEVIVANFFYQKETRQVLLGTSLWEQGLSGNNYVNTQYYGLAVFPGNWNPASGKRLKGAGDGADFWTGLGYDFARFSANLGVGQGFTPDSVNAALQSANIDWSIAPIRWTGGQASQQLHLFTPTANGFAPVNESEFRSTFDEAWR